jgi:hypothetical protein
MTIPTAPQPPTDRPAAQIPSLASSTPSAKKTRSLARVGFSVLLSLTALIVLFVALTPPAQQGFQQKMPPAATPTTAAPKYDLAALLSAYHTAQPPDGLPGGLIDPAAKDACDRLSTTTNPLPGEADKVATYFTVQNLQHMENDGTIDRQPFTVRLAQAQAIVAAAEQVYCPETPNTAPITPGAVTPSTPSQ